MERVSYLFSTTKVNGESISQIRTADLWDFACHLALMFGPIVSLDSDGWGTRLTIRERSSTPVNPASINTPK